MKDKNAEFLYRTYSDAKTTSLGRFPNFMCLRLESPVKKGKALAMC